MSLGIALPRRRVVYAHDAIRYYADPAWWGYSSSPPELESEWYYHLHLVTAAKKLQRRWRHAAQLRRAKERSHWSEVSRAHLNWRKSGCGRLLRKRKHLNTLYGKWELREAFLADKTKAEAKAEAMMRRADEKLLAAAKSGDEELVRALLAEGANLDCVEDLSYDPELNRSGSEMHMPLDLAVAHGHGQIACLILEKAGSGTMLRGMHPECVPTAHSPRELLSRCDVGASKRPERIGQPNLQRRALAKAVHVLLQSSYVDLQREPDGAPRFPARMGLVDARLPGVLMLGPMSLPCGNLLNLAYWANHDDLAARLYLAGVRMNLRLPRATPRNLRRFVARAVVRTLLRRHARAHLVAWYWREAAAKAKYATPDAAGFEGDMAAPVFSEGALGA